MARDPIDTVQFKLRIRESLRARIEEEADRNGQSINSEITARLEQSLRDDEALGGSVQAQFVRAMTTAMDRVTGEMDVPWYTDHDAWTVVRQAVLEGFSNIEPPKTDEPAFLQSDGFRESMEHYRQALADSLHRRRFVDRRLIALSMKRQGHGLSAEEQAEEEGLTAEQGQPTETPEPNLPADQLAEWRQWAERSVRIEQAYAAVATAFSYKAR